MLGQRAVTGFACDSCMRSGLLDVEYIRVAHFASCMAGIGDRTRGGFGRSGIPVVAVLAESCWYDGTTQDEEHDDSRDKQQRHPKEVLSVFEPLRH